MLHDPAHAERALESLHEHEVEHDARRRLGHRVAVSVDSPRIFLYAGTENAAREAEQVAGELTKQHGLSADFALDRWHPIEEEWENADAALPQTAAETLGLHIDHIDFRSGVSHLPDGGVADSPAGIAELVGHGHERAAQGGVAGHRLTA